MFALTNVRTEPVVSTRPAFTKPVITEEYYQDGVRMYESADNRHFIADALDKVFNVAAGIVKPKKYKGSNPNKKLAAVL